MQYRSLGDIQSNTCLNYHYTLILMCSCFRTMRACVSNSSQGINHLRGELGVHRDFYFLPHESQEPVYPT